VLAGIRSTFGILYSGKAAHAVARNAMNVMHTTRENLVRFVRLISRATVLDNIPSCDENIISPLVALFNLYKLFFRK